MDLDPAKALALARMDERRPDYTRAVLHDSGFGDLADQWLNDASAFQHIVRQERPPEQPEQEVSARVVRAYARMCVSWSRITQLRDQAVVSTERMSQPRGID